MKTAGRIALTGCLLLFFDGTARARSSHVTALQIPQVYRPIAFKFQNSKIPVLIPTWLPKFSTKVYPGFYTFARTAGVGGPGYGLDLYTSPTEQAHVNEVAGIYGKAGDTYTVSTHTIPVNLGKAGWAYIDPNLGSNAGYTIMVVRSFTSAVTAEDYTYTIDRTCPIVGRTTRPSFPCLEHVARSLARYTTG